MHMEEMKGKNWAYYLSLQHIVLIKVSNLNLAVGNNGELDAHHGQIYLEYLETFMVNINSFLQVMF